MEGTFPRLGEEEGCAKSGSPYASRLAPLSIAARICITRHPPVSLHHYLQWNSKGRPTWNKKKTKKEKQKAKRNSDSPRGQDHNSDPRNTFIAWTIGPGQEYQQDTYTRLLAGRPWWGWGSALPCRGTLSFAVESYILPVSTLRTGLVDADIIACYLSPPLCEASA